MFLSVRTPCRYIPAQFNFQSVQIDWFLFWGQKQFSTHTRVRRHYWWYIVLLRDFIRIIDKIHKNNLSHTCIKSIYTCTLGLHLFRAHTWLPKALGTRKSSGEDLGPSSRTPVGISTSERLFFWVYLWVCCFPDWSKATKYSKISCVYHSSWNHQPLPSRLDLLSDVNEKSCIDIGSIESHHDAHVWN